MIRIILLAIIASIGFAVYLAPAEWGFSMVKDKVAIKAQTITGTIWDIKAEKANFKNLTLDEVNINLNPINSLLNDGISSDLNIKQGKIDIDANCQAISKRNVTCTNVKGYVDLKDASILAQKANIPLIMVVEGGMNVDIDDVSLTDNSLTKLNGKVSIEVLKVLNIAVKGPFDITSVTKDNIITINIKDGKSADAIVEGVITIANKNVSINLKAKPKPKASKALLQSISMLGRADANGFYRVNRNIILK